MRVGEVLRRMPRRKETHEIGKDEHDRFDTVFADLFARANPLATSVRYKKDNDTIHVYRHTVPRTNQVFNTVRFEKVEYQDKNATVIQEETYTHDLQKDEMRYRKGVRIESANGTVITKNDPEISRTATIAFWLVKRRNWKDPEALQQDSEGKKVTLRQYNKLMSVLETVTAADLLAA